MKPLVETAMGAEAASTGVTPVKPPGAVIEPLKAGKVAPAPLTASTSPACQVTESSPLVSLS